MRVAILIDGGFYRKRAKCLWGEKAPSERADELFAYCLAHVRYKETRGSEASSLYRIFYYDCEPIKKKVYHPLLKRTIDLSKNDTYQWALDFLEELKKKRKVALRLGELSETSARYQLDDGVAKKLFAETMSLADVKETDFSFKAMQKGVDMKIGLDIASLAYKKQADQIVLISGDSDFVSAAKLARREGMDFILDPMWASIKKNLSEHVDGIRSPTKKPASAMPKLDDLIA